MNWYKADMDDLLVVYDDLDLPFGQLRVRASGSAGGHNGLKSLTAHLGNDYMRVRIGIGHPGHRERVIGHVMRDFAKADMEWLEPVLYAMSDAAPHLAKGEKDRFQTQVAHETQTGTD